MRILKFGGACLASPARLARLTAIIARTPRPLVVVVSAVAGVTDRLHEALADHLHLGGIARVAGELGALHRVLAPSEDGLFAYTVAAELEELAAALARVGSTGPAAHERVISAGERLAAPLVAAHLRAAGIEAEAFSAESAGIRCDGRPGAAVVDLDATRREAQIRLRSSLARGTIPVVAGYYGLGPAGETATFGRSGSDYSATALAHALDATRVELWKEVAGFLEADPRIIPEPRVISQLSYDEAVELAHSGARVIHPRALQPARDRDIPIHILGVDDPDARGTHISAATSSADGVLTAVTGRRHLRVLRIHGPSAARQQETMAAVAHQLSEQGIDILGTTSAQTALAVLIEGSDEERALDAINRVSVNEVEPARAAGLVCAVGHGIAKTRGMVGRLICAVVRQGIEIELICAGASTVACHLAVAEDEVTAATRAIYREFFRPHDTPGRLCMFSAPLSPARLPLAATNVESS